MRHHLSMLTFPSAPNHVRTRHKASASKWKSTFFFRQQNSTDFFFKSPNPLRTLSVHDVIHIPPSHFLSGDSIVTSLNDTSAPRAFGHLHSCLPLTNLCAKRKVLSLTKPKDTIYKTKSLGHYITAILETRKCVSIELLLQITSWNHCVQTNE